MSSVPPLKYWNTFFRLATSDTARATPDDHGPMMNFAPSESTASSARRVALPALVSSSRVMYLMGLPCTFIPRSSRASFMPRSSTGPTSENAPVNDQRPSMTTSFGWARSTAGNPSPAAAAAPPSFSTSRRVTPLMSGRESDQVGPVSRGRDRKENREHAASALDTFALHADRSTVELDELSRQREP